METTTRKFLDYGYSRFAVQPNKASELREETSSSICRRTYFVKNYSQQSRYSIHEIETDFWMGSLTTATGSVLTEMNFGSNEKKRDNVILIHHCKSAIVQWTSELRSRCSTENNAIFHCLHVENWLDQAVLIESLLELAQQIKALLAQGQRAILLEAPVSRHSEVVAALLLEDRGRRTQREALAHLGLRSCARGSDTRRRLAAALAWRELRSAPLFQCLPEGVQLKVLEFL